MISMQTTKIIQNNTICRRHTSENHAWRCPGNHFPERPSGNASKPLLPLLSYYLGVPWGLYSLRGTRKSPALPDQDCRVAGEALQCCRSVPDYGLVYCHDATPNWRKCLPSLDWPFLQSFQPFHVEITCDVLSLWYEFVVDHTLGFKEDNGRVFGLRPAYFSLLGPGNDGMWHWMIR